MGLQIHRHLLQQVREGSWNPILRLAYRPAHKRGTAIARLFCQKKVRTKNPADSRGDPEDKYHIRTVGEERKKNKVFLETKYQTTSSTTKKTAHSMTNLARHICNTKKQFKRMSKQQQTQSHDRNAGTKFQSQK